VGPHHQAPRIVVLHAHLSRRSGLTGDAFAMADVPSSAISTAGKTCRTPRPATRGGRDIPLA